MDDSMVVIVVRSRSCGFVVMVVVVGILIGMSSMVVMRSFIVRLLLLGISVLMCVFIWMYMI